MAINNIDTQFAIARSEVRALIDHCNSNTTIGGRSIDVLQSIVDTLDAIQKDSYDRPEGFHRHPVAVDPEPQNLTKPDFKLSSGLDKKDRKLLEEMRQTDRLC